MHLQSLPIKYSLNSIFQIIKCIKKKNNFSFFYVFVNNIWLTFIIY